MEDQRVLTQETLDNFLTLLVEEEQRSLLPPLIATLESGNEAENFFVRDMLRASLAKLFFADKVASTCVEIEGRKGIEHTVACDPAVYAEMLSYLQHTEALRNFDRDAGIIVGYYTTYHDQSIAAITICNGEHGPWIDAFLILPQGQFLGVRTPSLPPRRDLEAPFMFDHPDGTLRIVLLKPQEA